MPEGLSLQMTYLSNYQLGLAAEPITGGPRKLAHLATKAEQANIGNFYAMEAWRETIVPMTACALHTQNIKLGTAVMQIYPVNPVMVAIQAAELQQTSAGRFSLGLGLGGKFVVSRWYGVSHDRPLRRMREFIEIIRGVHASAGGQPFSYRGQIFDLRKYHLGDEPVLDVPINIAAVGPKMQELAGELSDGVMIGPLHSTEYLDRVWHRLAIGASRSGRNATDIQVYYHQITACHTDIEQACALARRSIIYLAQHEPYVKQFQLLGFGTEAVEINGLVRQHMYERAERLVTDTMLERLTVFGSPSECRRQLRSCKYAEAIPILMLVPFRTPENQILDSYEILIDGLTMQPL